MTLPNGAVGVATQQISTNWSNCTTVVESGTLLSPPPAAGPGGASSVAANGFAPAGAAATEPVRRPAHATSTNTHHFRVTWYDPVNLTLNWMQSNITATVSGSCVTSASGGANDYWETATGWKHDGPLSSYEDSNYWSCSGRAIQSYDSFDNSVFCYPDDIWTVYNGVECRENAIRLVRLGLRHSRDQRAGLPEPSLGRVAFVARAPVPGAASGPRPARRTNA